jgi:hypothetical protein
MAGAAKARCLGAIPEVFAANDLGRAAFEALHDFVGRIFLEDGSCVKHEAAIVKVGRLSSCIAGILLHGLLHCQLLALFGPDRPGWRCLFLRCKADFPVARPDF